MFDIEALGTLSKTTAWERLKPKIPNYITISRFILAFVTFGLISIAHVASEGAFRALWFVAGLSYAVAAFGDILDGYLARKWNVRTAFGVIADPVADKILNCGTLAFFAVTVKGWRLSIAFALCVVLAREFLSTSMRAYFEEQSARRIASGKNPIPFPADAWGKRKMWTQSASIGLLFIAKSFLTRWPNFSDATVTFAIVVIIAVAALSGWHYIKRTAELIRTNQLT